MDIDIETGLPKLPENLFWRVRHRRYNVSNSFDCWTATDTHRLQVQLIRNYTITRLKNVEKRNWFGRKRWVFENYEDVAENPLFTEDTLGTNKIAVQNAANRIMKLWEKAKERDALIGDYPPKSLNANV